MVCWLSIELIFGSNEGVKLDLDFFKVSDNLKLQKTLLKYFYYFVKLTN